MLCRNPGAIPLPLRCWRICGGPATTSTGAIASRWTWIDSPGLSVIRRSFEATYDETAIRYLTRRRIERAQDLLRVANLTVTEVCMAVGFASLGSLSTRFTQLVGESPTAYRDRWAARGGPHVPGCFLFMRGVLNHAETAGDPAERSLPLDKSPKCRAVRNVR